MNKAEISKLLQRVKDNEINNITLWEGQSLFASRKKIL